MSGATLKKIDFLEIYGHFPLLLPSEKYDKWEGFLITENVRYQVVLKTPHYPSLKDIKLFCSETKPEELVFLEKEEGGSFLDYLLSLEEFLKNKSSQINHNNFSNIKYLKTYAHVIKEIETHIGRENVVELENSLKWVKLKYDDLSSDIHFIKVLLDSAYPSSPLQVLEADLPDEIISQLKEIHLLGTFYLKFKELIISLSDFWNVCQQLSEEAWITEPEDPKRKDVHRRVLISDNLSINLVFNPMNPFSMPDVRFLGSMNTVSQARMMYQKKLEEEGWREDESVAKNLSRLLNMESLPMKQTGVAQAEEIECVICYTYTIEREPPPSKWCSNQHCAGWFHHTCLLEWLNSVPTSKPAFDHISGPCPHCDEKLFCPLTLS